MKKLLLLLLLPFFMIKPTFGACTITQPVDSVPMPLQLANITAGDDIATGTTLYKQTYNLAFGSTFTLVNCAASVGQFIGVYSYVNTPSGGPIYGVGPSGATVYPTNIPGVGMYAAQGTNTSIYFPGSKYLSDQNNGGAGCASGTSCNVINNFKRWDVYLIKTGPISPGVLLGNSLPCIQVNFNNTGSSSDGLVESVCFSGSINIISSTCLTPDVNVNLGNHQVTEFSGTGSATDWVDASIQLVNCPVYYGYGSSGNWYQDSTGTNGGGTPIQNSLTLKLTPNTTVTDSANGIISLTPADNNAQGVAVQLAYGTNASPTLVNFSNTKNYPRPLNSSGNVTLPLVARYIQTSPSISSGTANSAVTFLIDYY